MFTLYSLHMEHIHIGKHRYINWHLSNWKCVSRLRFNFIDKHIRVRLYCRNYNWVWLYLVVTLFQGHNKGRDNHGWIVVDLAKDNFTIEIGQGYRKWNFATLVKWMEALCPNSVTELWYMAAKLSRRSNNRWHFYCYEY